VGNPGSSGFDYVHVFDTVNKVEVGRSSEIMRAVPRLAMTADHNTLYDSEVILSPQKIYRFDISTDTPVQTAAAPHGPVSVNTLAVTPDGSQVYSSRGQVWNGDLNTQLGSFSPSGEEIEYVPGLNRFYISNGAQMSEFDGVDQLLDKTRNCHESQTSVTGGSRPSLSRQGEHNGGTLPIYSQGDGRPSP
jgi:hypothetical protein